MDNVVRGATSRWVTVCAFLSKWVRVGSLLGFVVLLPHVATAGSVPATRGIGQCPCQCPNGRTVWINKNCGNESDCYGPCGITGSTPSGRDFRAEQRAREEAEEAARIAEERRRREAELERQRLDADNKRHLEEIERQTRFLNDRDAAAGMLRRATGTGPSVSGSGGTGLRSSTGIGAASNAEGGPVLRDSGADTGLRGLKTGATQAPNLDPMVVDARNVPSGLPKSVDDYIPHTPAGERVRKGFQAVQAGDWKAALAWFQDARTKEPGNAGLGRLVDLAKFTLYYRPPVKTPPVAKQPAYGAKAEPVAPGQDAHGGAVELAVANRMAARERFDAAVKKYEEKYGDRDVFGRLRAGQRAARGEGYSDEELKAQLQKALIEYRKNWRKNHPDGHEGMIDGGPPTADEITLGGKG
ncbi:MAG: hypothetical protein OHK0028_13260 [Deltaproteobacteria bacterium]